MHDPSKTNQELIEENTLLKQRIQELERSESERKRAEKALQESEERFRRLLQNVPGIAIQGYSQDGTTTYWNQASERLYGYTAQEAIGQNLLNLIIPPEMRIEVQKDMQQMIETGEPIPSAELSLMTKDRSHVAVFSNHAIVNLPDSPLELFCLDIDLSERKRVEETLRESMEKYLGIFDESVAAVYTFDNKKNFIDTNQAGLDLLGYSREELLHMSIPDVDADPLVVLPAHQELLSGGRIINYEHKLRRKDGTVITVLNNSRPLKDSTHGNIVGMLSTLIDITDRKKAEDALRESEERHRTILQTAMDGIWRVDAQGRLVEVNHAYCRMSGYSEQELLTMRIPDLEVIETAADTAGHLQKIIAHGEDRFESQHRRKDGNIFDVEISCQYRPTDNGQIVAFLRDITERKRVEEELSKSRRFLSDLIEYSGALICVKNREGRYELINSKWEQVTGLKRRDIIGRTDEELFPGHIGKQFRLNDLEVMESGYLLEKEEIFEDEHGTRFFISIKFPLRDDDVVWGICGMFTEITERKQAEQALRESENLYRIFINATSDMVFLKDELLRNVVVNKSMASFFGKPEEEIIGKTDFELMTQFAAEKCMQTDMESLSNKSIFSSEEIIGDHVYETLKFPVELGQNRIGVGGIIRDITERKQAEQALRESEARLLTILNATPFPVALVDVQDDIIDFWIKAPSPFSDILRPPQRSGIS